MEISQGAPDKTRAKYDDGRRRIFRDRSGHIDPRAKPGKHNILPRKFENLRNITEINEFRQNFNASS